MSKPKVAVIAIHGVGDHKAGATSAQVAAQLQHFYPGQFAAFECTPLRIAVDASVLPVPPAPGPAPGGRRLPESVRARALSAVPQPGRECGDIAFTGMTLAEGADYTATYDTTRLRCGAGFDLYDMFWADLSHGGTKGGLTILRQMMQLLLHVACLGRTALSTLVAVRGRTNTAPGLKHACAAASLGYWLLAVPIALGNLLLLCFGAAFLGLFVPDDAPASRVGVAIGGALLAAVLLGAACRAMMRRQTTPSWLERWGVPGIWLAAVAVAALGVKRYPASMPPSSAAFVLALAAALVAGTAVARLYEVSRPSVMAWWWALLGVCTLWGVAGAATMWAHKASLEGRHVLAFLVEAAFCWLLCAWAVLTLNNLWLLATGLRAKLAAGADMAVKRAVNTALVAAAVPASLLLIVVLTLWFLFSLWLKSKTFEVLTQPVRLLLFGESTVAELIDKLIALSAGPAAVPFLLCMAVVFAGLVVAIAPSVFAELFPPKPAGDKQAWAARSLALWRWLNGGFGLLGCGAVIAVAAFFILLPGGGWSQYRFDHLDTTDLGLTLGVGALAFFSVTRVFGAVSIGKVARTFARLRVVVDTAIDVDNWLRERPEGATPRLRIMARYASLLRHLRDEGYGRIVIVAHSQGTVITADLLRYLKARNATLLRGLGPIDLLTFGSPLRQLYAARFPSLYGWIEDAPYADTMQQAGVASWTNGYGSGDYVGRNLWPGGQPSSPPWRPDAAPGQAEFCTGALAHTHYFDEHSPDVAAAVRDTILDAVDWCDQRRTA
ncbi:MAG: hypothetical protein ACJ8HJ_14070 [Massilia sp.]